MFIASHREVMSPANLGWLALISVSYTCSHSEKKKKKKGQMASHVVKLSLGNALIKSIL